MAESDGLVSITIPFFNAERFLRETVESVLAQTYTNWELLLVDDGSTDRSTELAKSLAAQRPGQIFYLGHDGHRNLGVNAARNLGARHSRGGFLAFLDSDDIWLPAKLEAGVTALEAHPEAWFYFGSTEYWYEWDPEGNNHERNRTPSLAPAGRVYQPPQLLAKSYPLGSYGAPCPSSFLLRREAFERVGGFDECFHRGTYQLYEDIAFLSKMYLLVPVYIGCECLEKNRCSRYSMTRQPDTIRNEEAARRYYFRWLEDYLRNQAVIDSELWRAVHAESWFYRLPLPAARLIRRVRGKWMRWRSR